MTAAQRLLIVIGGCLILFLLAVFIVYPALNRAPAAAPQTTPTVTDPSQLNPLPVQAQPEPTVSDTSATTNQPVEMSVASQRAEVERLARLFVERFGSYSNFSNFENITTMEPFMTQAMLSYAKGLMKAPVDQSVGNYTGVTSTVVSLNTTAFTAKQSASVSFVVQQETQAGLNAPIQTAYRDGHMDLVYSGGQWLVDGLYYNKK